MCRSCQPRTDLTANSAQAHFGNADPERLIYYFESALAPNIFWMNFKEIDFSEKGKVMKLDLGTNQNHVFAGDIVKDFQPTALFKFLGLEP